MRMELRRGMLTLAVLRALATEQYGYSLRKKLSQASIEIEEGTLYPLVRRLEAAGLLKSEWRDNDVRRRRYYKLSERGAVVLEKLTQEWVDLNAALDNLSATGLAENEA